MALSAFPILSTMIFKSINSTFVSSSFHVGANVIIVCDLLNGCFFFPFSRGARFSGEAGDDQLDRLLGVVLCQRLSIGIFMGVNQIKPAGGYID